MVTGSRNWSGCCESRLLVGAGGSVPGRRNLVAQGGVRPVVVVFLLPVGDDDAGVGEGPEQVDVQALVTEPSVERFDVAVAPGLVGRDEPQAGPLASPLAHGGAGELGPVVAAQHRGVAAAGREPVQLGDKVLAGDGPVDQAAEALAGALVHDRDDLDRTAVGSGAELEIHCPYLVRRVRRGQAGDGADPGPLAAAAEMTIGPATSAGNLATMDRAADGFVRPRAAISLVIQDRLPSCQGRR